MYQALMWYGNPTGRFHNSHLLGKFAIRNQTSNAEPEHTLSSYLMAHDTENVFDSNHKD
ncbi:hypothetical protein RRG08_058333 [Elysia crispata]|uniref:Uncharacterized protein n=1 Tax=Elysia crispata TaxID=231223 RepID=A0AAE1B4B6_9GAST|nr:hypothetical protein RRG08_058333 [Elysia crispata]